MTTWCIFVVKVFVNLYVPHCHYVIADMSHKLYFVYWYWSHIIVIVYFMYDAMMHRPGSRPQKVDRGQLGWCKLSGVDSSELNWPQVEFVHKK